ncbi:MAG: PKD domain-containing protein [Candidatus Electrothrix sp. AU1_5]|nr:PKD domain-containing protein [Candidatus Electrothrix gigas]
MIGDIDSDGTITLNDANLVFKHISNTELLSSENISSADVDFNGEITTEDAIIIAEAANNSQQIASRILQSEASPGAAITIMSPELLDIEGTFSIEVGNSIYIQNPSRVVRGYATFMVPLDPTVQNSISVTPGPVEVRLLRNGVVVDSYTLKIIKPEPLPDNPKEELRKLLDELIEVLALYESATSEELTSRGISGENYDILQGIITSAKLEATEAFINMKEVLEKDGGDELAKLFFIIANANGISNARELLQSILQENPFHNLRRSSMQGESPGDIILTPLCLMKSIVDGVKTTGTIVSFVCDALLAGTLIAAAVPADGPVVDVGLLATWVGLCAKAELGISLANTLVFLIAPLDADLKFDATPLSPQPNESVNIKASIEAIGWDSLCGLGASAGLQWINKKLAERAVGELIRRKVTVRSIFRVFQKFGGDYYNKLLIKLQNSVSTLISQTKIDQAIENFINTGCERFGGVDMILDANGILTGPVPNKGNLSFSSDGTAEYLCPDCSSEECLPLIAFTAKKKICGEDKRKTVKIQCEDELTACFTSSPSRGKAPLIVFLNSSCSMPNENIAGYTWSASNGWGESNTSTVSSLIFESPGEYTVTLTVTDEFGNTDTSTQQIIVEDKDDDRDNKEQGVTNGDPHLYTFDNLAYDFQAVGEFILVKSLIENDPFEIQTRQSPWSTRTDVSVNRAVAMNVGQDRVGLYSEMDPFARINGNPQELVDGDFILPEGGKITKFGRMYTITWPDKKVLVDIYDSSWGLIIDVYIDESYTGKVTGLLGDSDGSPENDIKTREGSNLGTTLDFETLYPGYADSWRISQNESLFDYMTGETTETFTNRDFPYTLSQPDNLPEEMRINAEQVCRNAGITNPVVLENCILDVILTGENGFAEASQHLDDMQITVEVTPPPPAQFGDYGFGKFAGNVLDGILNQNITGASVNLTINSNPLLGISDILTANGFYETSVVAVGSGYKLSINADSYIPEQVFDLTVPNQQIHEVEPVRLLPSSLSGKMGSIIGTARNALDNSVLPNLNVQIRRYINKRTGDIINSTQTDQNGSFSFVDLESGNYTVEFYGDGYITNYVNALSIGDAVTTKDVVISPQLGSSQFRIVLSWGESPSDLDSHLTGPYEDEGRFHIYYGNRGNESADQSPYAWLDRDDMNSFGPETITIFKLVPGESYRYSVYDFVNGGFSSSDALANSGAKVEVYGDSGLITSFTVPNQGGTLWTVFEMDASGNITPINNMSYENDVRSQQAARRQNFKPIQTDYWQILHHTVKKKK